MNIFEVEPRRYHSDLVCNRANIRDPKSFLSKSVLFELAEHGSLYKWRYHPKAFVPTSFMQWGSLVDCLSLTPELAEQEIAITPFDSFRTNEAKKWKAEQQAASKIISDPDTVNEAKKAAKMLTETHPLSAAIYRNSKKQVIVAGGVLGCKMKGLLDLVPHNADFIPDLKTTSAFSAEGFCKQMATLAYHAQGAAYLALWNASHPTEQRHKFKLIWQESSPPYEVALTEISQADLEAGWHLITTLVQRILDATDSGHWPFAFENELLISRPTWAAIQEEAALSLNQQEPT